MKFKNHTCKKTENRAVQSSIPSQEPKVKFEVTTSTKIESLQTYRVTQLLSRTTSTFEASENQKPMKRPLDPKPVSTNLVTENTIKRLNSGLKVVTNWKTGKANKSKRSEMMSRER